jgi:hypothetical protein
VLLVTAAGSESPSPGAYSDNQVSVGPFRNLTLPDGGEVPFRTPKGEFDFEEAFLKRVRGLPAADLLIVAPGPRVMMPRNIGAFKGPKMLLIADTHYGATLEGQLQYAASEPFDFVFMTKRQHAHWFRELLGDKVYWLPYIADEPPQFRPLAPAPAPEILMIGSVDPRFYKRRRRLCKELLRRGYPLKFISCAPSLAPDFFNRSLIVLNVTCNGDANARFVSVPAASSFLLTDRVPEAAGVSLYYTEGQHYEAFGDPEELFAKADHFLRHPHEAVAISKRAHARCSELLQPEMMRERFWKIIDTRRQDDLFTLADDPRFGRYAPTGLSHFSQDVILYELLQDRQREAEVTNVLILPGVSSRLPPAAADLPRVRMHMLEDDADTAQSMLGIGLQGRNARTVSSETAHQSHWDIVVGPVAHAVALPDFDTDSWIVVGPSPETGMEPFTGRGLTAKMICATIFTAERAAPRDIPATPDALRTAV